MGGGQIEACPTKGGGADWHGERRSRLVRLRRSKSGPPRENPSREAVPVFLEPSPRTCRQKILAAFTSVFQTPQASGIPTKAQNSTACRSSPPLPMPKDPDVAAPAALCLACNAATSSGFMNHLSASGL